MTLPHIIGSTYTTPRTTGKEIEVDWGFSQKDEVSPSAQVVVAAAVLDVVVLAARPTTGLGIASTKMAVGIRAPNTFPTSASAALR